jgi:colicin import membrane protein
MKTSANTAVLFGPSRNAGFRGMFLISFVVHLLAVSAMFFLPNLSASRTYYSPVYSVRLVNLPSGSGTAEEKPAPRASEPSLPAPASRPEEKLKGKEKPLSTAPKEETEKKISDAIEKLRKKKEGKALDNTLDRMRQRQEEKRVDAAIDRLRSDRESRQVNSAIEGIRRKVTIGTSGAVESAPSGTGGASGVMSIKFKIYYNLIWQRIRSAWVLPEGALKGKKDLETIISIRIARDGQIEDIQFEKRSGNAALDESALRAIKKANPLPPLPPGMEGDKFDLGVRFTPSDL